MLQIVSVQKSLASTKIETDEKKTWQQNAIDLCIGHNLLTCHSLFFLFVLIWCLCIMAGNDDNGIGFCTEIVHNHDCQLIVKHSAVCVIMISQSRPTEYFKTMRVEKICQLRNNIIRLVFVCIRQVFWMLRICRVCVCVHQADYLRIASIE